MGSLVLGTLIGLLIALPQLIPALRYYPQSVRSLPRRKVLGVPFRILLNGFLTPRSCDQVRGVFFPEVCVFVGWLPLVSAWYAPLSYWHLFFLLGIAGAMGKWMPPGFRLPARFCWLMSFSVAMLGMKGLAYLPVSPAGLTFLVLLQTLSLILASWKLLPMEPFCQRWERPLMVFDTPLTRLLATSLGRVSGLPYPLRTGQVNQILTLGYNGGSQPIWMKSLRRDRTSEGAGAHDWFLTRGDGQLLDRYGVVYAYTFRPLRHPKWHPTPIRHLSSNTQAVLPVPSWSHLASLRPSN